MKKKTRQNQFNNKQAWKFLINTNITQRKEQEDAKTENFSLWYQISGTSLNGFPLFLASLYVADKVVIENEKECVPQHRIAP